MRKRHLLWAMVLLVGATGSCEPIPPDPYAPAAKLFLAQADATTDASRPDTALGLEPTLEVGGTPDRVSYLRFAVSGLPAAPVTRVLLELHPRTPLGMPPAGLAVATVAGPWTESDLTWSERPPVGDVVGSTATLSGDGWVRLDVTPALSGDGTVDLALSGSAAEAVGFDAREGGAATAPRLWVTTQRPEPPEEVLLAAGDVAGCAWQTDEATARLLDARPDATIAVLGDAAQVAGTAAEYADCFGPTWGRHLDRIRPAIGNHDYLTDGGGPYWDYFGAAAGERGKGWYSYDLGAWHVVVLNGSCWKVGGCEAGSPQEQWLRADLAATDRICTLAYWHQPRFSSVAEEPAEAALWQALYDNRAEIVLNGHEHGYERFAPQRPDRTVDPGRGIRQFTVATGGTPYFYAFGPPAPNSEVRDNQSHGVLQLTLARNAYTWEFLPVEGDTFTDQGSGTCH